MPKPGDTGGAKIVLDALADRIAETEVDVRYQTGATNLVVDGDRVVGVAWRRYGERGFIRTGSVVIAAGGYVGNEHPDFPLCPFIDGWETVEEIEAALGIPSGNLVATLASYNEHAADKQDPDFHKHPDWLEPQDHGPWGAYDLSLGKAMYAGFTLGGLRVNLDGQAQRTDLSVVPGLYAAGACAVNIAPDGKGYASGIQLAEGSYFGRRAARHAAAHSPDVR